MYGSALRKLKAINIMLSFWVGRISRSVQTIISFRLTKKYHLNSGFGLFSIVNQVLKISFAFKAISLTLTIIVLVVFSIIGLTKNEYPNLLLLVKVLIGTLIVFPIFIIGLAYIEWLSKRQIRNKAFKQQPFDELDKIGFTVSYLYDKSKWYFTEETKELSINNYLIQCDIRRESPNIIEFKTFVKHEEIDQERFKILEAKFKHQEIYFDFDGLIKQYNIKKTMNLTIGQVKTELSQFVQTLKEEGFVPYVK